GVRAVPRHARGGRHDRVHAGTPRAGAGLARRAARPRRAHRAQLRAGGGARDAVRAAGRAVLRLCGGRRTAPQPQGRRPVGHRGAHRTDDRERPLGGGRRTGSGRDRVRGGRRPRRRPRRRAGAFGALARSRGARGDHVRRRGGDPDDPPRLDGPDVVHARRVARRAGDPDPARPHRGPGEGARPVKARNVAIVLTAAVALYLVLLAGRAIALLRTGELVPVLLGAGVLVLPLLGAWMLWTTWRSGNQIQRLARRLEAEGGLPDVSDLPRRPSGRVDRQ